MINGRNSAAYRQLGYCLFVQKQYEQAESEYRKAIEMGADAQAHAGIGVVMMMRYIAQQEPRDESLRSRALEHWQRSLDLDPRQPKLAALLAKYSQVPANNKMISQTGL